MWPAQPGPTAPGARLPTVVVGAPLGPAVAGLAALRPVPARPLTSWPVTPPGRRVRRLVAEAGVTLTRTGVPVPVPGSGVPEARVGTSGARFAVPGPGFPEAGIAWTRVTGAAVAGAGFAGAGFSGAWPVERVRIAGPAVAAVAGPGIAGARFVVGVAGPAGGLALPALPALPRAVLRAGLAAGAARAGG